MTVALWLERIALVQLIALLSVVHAVAIWVWYQTGAWPHYKAPTSWVVSPISDYTFLFNCVLVWLLCNLGTMWIAGVWSLGRAVFLLMRRGKQAWRAVGFHALMLASIVVLLTDPAGALFWFFD